MLHKSFSFAAFLSALALSGVAHAGHVDTGDILNFHYTFTVVNNQDKSSKTTEGDQVVRVTQGCDPENASSNWQCRVSGLFTFEVLQDTAGARQVGSSYALYMDDHIKETMDRCGKAVEQRHYQIEDQLQTVDFNGTKVLACVGLPGTFWAHSIYTPASPLNWIQKAQVYPDSGWIIYTLTGFTHQN